MTERLPLSYVSYVLSIGQDRAGLDLDGLNTAWSLTQTGLVQIGKFRPLARPVAVIGSTAEDFAFAVALDRMYGATIWAPVEWTQDPHLRWLLQEGYYGLVNAARFCRAAARRHDHLAVAGSARRCGRYELARSCLRCAWRHRPGSARRP